MKKRILIVIGGCGLLWLSAVFAFALSEARGISEIVCPGGWTATYENEAFADADEAADKLCRTFGLAGHELNDVGIEQVNRIRLTMAEDFDRQSDQLSNERIFSFAGAACSIAEQQQTPEDLVSSTLDAVKPNTDKPYEDEAYGDLALASLTVICPAEESRLNS